jgi:Putative peptidoglycan binding domain
MSAGYMNVVDGNFSAAMTTAVQSFQIAHGLSADGIIGPMTWQALLQYPPAAVIWTKKGGTPATGTPTAPGTVTASMATRGRIMPVPKSASLPARRDEIPANIGAGRP